MKSSKYQYHKDLKNPSLGIGNISLTSPIIKVYLKLLYREVRKFKPSDNIQFRSFEVKCSDGESIISYIVEPKNAKEDLPVIFYFHGGGFFAAMQVMMLRNAEFYAHTLNCRVILPEYRLIPKYSFPTPVEDCYDTVCEVVKNHKMYKVDNNQVVIYGDSAGGCLAASVVQRLRDRKGPKVCGQMLIYPVIDDSVEYESLKLYKDAPWSTNANRQMWSMYQKNSTGTEGNYAAPIKNDLHNLPRTYVEPQEMDILRDEAIAYAQKLEQAGVQTTVNLIHESFHGFDSQINSPLVQKVLLQRCKVMKEMWRANS